MTSSRIAHRTLPLRWLLPALIAFFPEAAGPAPASGHVHAHLRFVVGLRQGLVASPQDGRLLVILGRRGDGEPRLGIGLPDKNDAILLGRDVRGLRPGGSMEVDDSAAAYPLRSLDDLPAGDYYVQALLATNRDLRGINRPGDLFSVPVKVSLSPRRREPVRLDLSLQEPPETLPPDTRFVKYLKIPSRLLSEFHGRPIYLRAAVILPRVYDEDPSRRYPLWIHIGGYGQRYTDAAQWMGGGSEFERAWAAPDAPSLLVLHLDGAGPFGDPYQVNSANNGPYGDAVTQELIPYVEKTFRAMGTPASRVLEGASTGGWVSLALQVFYPDLFNGAWSFCPDGVDFRAFQLLNIYSDDNAYVNARGFERPSARNVDGDVLFTMRRELQLENVLGAGDSWTLSGEQWGAWNAVYSPRRADGMPVPLWDPATGKIDHAVAESWKKYDLRLQLEGHWKELGPRLQGKIHVWVGDADTFFLNNAVHLLDNFLAGARPAYQGSITYGPREKHCWMGLSERELMARLAAAAGEGPAIVSRSARGGGACDRR
jgi:Putative esterase